MGYPTDQDLEESHRRRTPPASREPSIQAQAVADVLSERERQDRKWGEQNHDPITYLAILTEEVGETAQAALEARFGKGTIEHLREEAVQAAAVALAIVECIDRAKWTWAK